MLQRHLHSIVIRELTRYPAVALVGPRQCGKTTLARAIDGVYFDLEQEADYLRLDLYWDTLVKGPELVIIDEAQCRPELFPRLRGAIDGDRKRNGRFLLLGSVSPALMTEVAEALTGRISLCELAPFCLDELAGGGATLMQRWLCGGYPDGGILPGGDFPNWQRNYLTLLAQRDLPNWGLHSKPELTDRLMRMIAAMHGQTLNASRLGQSLGISYHTVSSYIDVFIGAFLIRSLPSYQANLGKRLVKSPKIFWRDSGLLHALQGVSDDNALLTRPWVGASFEGFVIEEIITACRRQRPQCQASFFRSSDQREIDLLIEIDAELLAIEIKLTSAPSVQDFKRLNDNADMVGAQRRFLISQTAETSGDEHRGSYNLKTFLELVRAIYA